jgi:hypothetical protein
VRQTLRANLTQELGITTSNSNGVASMSEIQTALSGKLKAVVAGQNIDTQNWDQIGNAGQQRLLLAALQAADAQFATTATSNASAV